MLSCAMCVCGAPKMVYLSAIAVAGTPNSTGYLRHVQFSASSPSIGSLGPWHNPRSFDSH
jgi:hypothetical protein